MNDQNDFDFTPASRNTDPATSHQAEKQFTILGQRATRCRQVLGLICINPGATTGELARLMHLAYPDMPIASAVESPHKRVKDLESKGLVRRYGARVCRDTGRERLTWHATQLGQEVNLET